MDKLEKSIRSALRDYGNALRAGKYYATSVGYEDPDKYELAYAAADIDIENGVVTDIRIYAEPITLNKYDLPAFNLTEDLEDYLREVEPDWDSLIFRIKNHIQEYIDDAVSKKEEGRDW